MLCIKTLKKEANKGLKTYAKYYQHLHRKLEMVIIRN